MARPEYRVGRCYGHGIGIPEARDTSRYIMKAQSWLAVIYFRDGAHAGPKNAARRFDLSDIGGSDGAMVMKRRLGRRRQARRAAL